MKHPKTRTFIWQLLAFRILSVQRLAKPWRTSRVSTTSVPLTMKTSKNTFSRNSTSTFFQWLIILRFHLMQKISFLSKHLELQIHLKWRSIMMISRMKVKDSSLAEFQQFSHHKLNLKMERHSQLEGWFWWNYRRKIVVNNSKVMSEFNTLTWMEKKGNKTLR